MGSKYRQRVPPGTKEKAINLRLSGFSYREIQEKLQVSSRGTLSHWLKDLALSADAKKRLLHTTEKTARSGFKKFNDERSRKIRDADATAYITGKDLVGALTQREIFLI